MKIVSIVVVMEFWLQFACLYGAGVEKQQVKLKQAAAKTYLEQGKHAEEEANSRQARMLYLKAESVIFTKDAERGLDRLDARDRQRVKELLTAAQRAWMNKEFATSATVLSDAEQIQPGNATVLYDLSLVRRKQNLAADSELLLMRAVAATTNERVRLRLVSTLSEWREGTVAEKVNAAGVTKQYGGADEVNRSILISQGRWLSSADSDVDDTRDPCSALSQLTVTSEESAALQMDRGLCSALDGDFAASSRLLGSIVLQEAYADGARRALASLMDSLSKLPPPEGEMVRALYKRALGQIAKQDFNAALKSYGEAAERCPSFWESSRQYALLADALGETDKSLPAWRSLLNAPEASMQAEAREAIAAAETKEGLYRTAIGLSREPMETLLRRHLIDGDLAHKHYAMSQMEQCALHLQEAAAIHPLAPEVQTIGALLAMQRNDFARAEWHGRSLAAFGATLSFYGAVYTHAPGDAKHKKYQPIHFARVDIVRDGIYISELSVYNPRKHKTVTQGAGTGSLLSDSPSRVSFTTSAKIRKLETHDEYLHVELLENGKKMNKLWIEPLHLALEVPPQGPAARRFANQYTHLVAKTIGYDTAKFGKESLTFGERVRLAYDFANLGLETYSAVMNPMGAYDAYRGFRKVTALLAQDTKSLARVGDNTELVTFFLPFQFLSGAVPQEFSIDLK